MAFKQLVFVPSLALFVLLSACSISTDDLAKEVQASIQQKFSGKGIQVKKLTLVHKGGNNYTGILVTNEYGVFEGRYSVDVVYDGNNYSWQTRKIQ
jgi:IS5 family transposase